MLVFYLVSFKMPGLRRHKPAALSQHGEVAGGLQKQPLFVSFSAVPCISLFLSALVLADRSNNEDGQAWERYPLQLPGGAGSIRNRKKHDSFVAGHGNLK